MPPRILDVLYPPCKPTKKLGGRRTVPDSLGELESEFIKIFFNGIFGVKGVDVFLYKKNSNIVAFLSRGSVNMVTFMEHFGSPQSTAVSIKFLGPLGVLGSMVTPGQRAMSIQSE
jgi:hypothetical protein